MDSSIILARLCQCALPSTTCFLRLILDSTESTSQTASRLVQPFLHSSCQIVPILCNRPPLPLKTAPSHGGSGHPCIIQWVYTSPQPKRHLDPFSGFLQSSLSWETDRQSDQWTNHATLLVTTGCIYVHSTAMQLYNEKRAAEKSITFIC